MSRHLRLSTHRSTIYLIAHSMPETTVLHQLPPPPAPLIEKANNLFSYLMYGNGQLGEQLEAVYRFIDEFNTFLAPFMSCKKGCSHCCHIDVQITTLEAELIQVQQGIPVHQAPQFTQGHRDPCPFLVPDGSCSIYESRPLICRMHQVVGEPENCQQGRNQLTYVDPRKGHFGNDIFANLIRWLGHIVQSNPGCRFADIRDFFPVKNHPR